MSNLSDRTRALITQAKAIQKYTALVIDTAQELVLEAHVLQLRARSLLRKQWPPLRDREARQNSGDY